MHWAHIILLLFGGAVGGFALGLIVMASFAGVKYCKAVDEQMILRVALGGLVRACEGDTCTLHSEGINQALERAREALEK